MVCIMQMGGRFFCPAQGEGRFIKQGWCKAEQIGDTVPCQRYCPTMGYWLTVCEAMCVCVCVRARVGAGVMYVCLECC